MPTGHPYPFPGGNSGALTLDATDTSQYTEPLCVPNGSVFAFQLDWQSTGDDLAATGEMQETCIRNPDTATDTDWVTSSDVTITAVAATDTPVKQLVNVGNLGSALVRFKFTRSAGSGTIQVYWSIKKTHS